MRCSLLWSDISVLLATLIFTVGIVISTHKNGTATINARQIMNLLEEAIKVVQEIDGMATSSRTAVWAQPCSDETTTERFGNLICLHVQVKNGSHKYCPRHALNTEPVSEIICYNPRTEADLAGETLCCAVRCVALRCAVLCCDALRCAALLCVALRCAALCCVVMRCVALRCVALRCVVL